MATTTAQRINIRESSEPQAHPALSGDTFYHGALGCIAGTGYIENLDSASLGAIVGVVNNINGGYDQAGTASTGTGSINGGLNLVTAYTDGFIDSIPFNSDLAVTDVGRIAYAKDNFTLTCDPKYGIMPVGIVTKYYSTSKGEVKLNSYATDGVYTFVDQIVPVGDSSIWYAIANPIGRTVGIKDWHVNIVTGASSASPTSMGIAATSTTPATNVVDTAALVLTSGNYFYGPAQTTNFKNNVRWTSSQYLVVSCCSHASTVGTTSTLVAYIKLRYEVL